jgi:hypothetical protein
MTTTDSRLRTAFAEAEWRGLLLTARLRLAILAVFALWLPVENAWRSLLFYYPFLVGFALIGLAPLALRRAGLDALWQRYLFPLLDVGLFTAVVLIPNPVQRGFPPPLMLRFGNEIYLFVLSSHLSLTPTRTSGPTNPATDAKRPIDFGGETASCSTPEQLLEVVETRLVDALDCGNGVGFARTVRSKLTRPFDCAAGLSLLLLDPNRRFVVGHRKWSLLDRVRVHVLVLAERLEAFDDARASGQLHSAHAATLLELTLLDCRMPVRQCIEAADQTPYLVARDR